MRIPKLPVTLAAAMLFGCFNAIIETDELVSLDTDKTVYSTNFKFPGQ